MVVEVQFCRIKLGVFKKKTKDTNGKQKAYKMMIWCSVHSIHISHMPLCAKALLVGGDGRKLISV